LRANGQSATTTTMAISQSRFHRTLSVHFTLPNGENMGSP